MTLLKTVHTILFELLTFESPVSSNFEQFLTQLHPPPPNFLLPFAFLEFMRDLGLYEGGLFA